MLSVFNFCLMKIMARFSQNQNSTFHLFMLLTFHVINKQDELTICSFFPLQIWEQVLVLQPGLMGLMETATATKFVLSLIHPPIHHITWNVFIPWNFLYSFFSHSTRNGPFCRYWNWLLHVRNIRFCHKIKSVRILNHLSEKILCCFNYIIF